MADARERALENYRRKLVEHRELEAKLKKERQAEQKLNKDFEKSEDDLKALQSVGQIVGEVLKQLTEEKFIVKVSPAFSVKRCRQRPIVSNGLLILFFITIL